MKHCLPELHIYQPSDGLLIYQLNGRKHDLQMSPSANVRSAPTLFKFSIDVPTFKAWPAEVTLLTMTLFLPAIAQLLPWIQAATTRPGEFRGHSAPHQDNHNWNSSWRQGRWISANLLEHPTHGSQRRRSNYLQKETIQHLLSFGSARKFESVGRQATSKTYKGLRII